MREFGRKKLVVNEILDMRNKLVTVVFLCYVYRISHFFAKDFNVFPSCRDYTRKTSDWKKNACGI